jgi:hypothetical protein
LEAAKESTATMATNPPDAMMAAPPDAARPLRPAQQRANAPLPQLGGIAQVLGLALGSPEFQRR